MEQIPQVDMSVNFFLAINVIPGKATFVTLDLEGQTYCTRDEVDVNPHWHQTFIFNVSLYLTLQDLKLQASPLL
ncbi:hypothetical protein C5167_029506 [Papaver somniferum]|nr:hypothetical protein C5167_029506 [Papaver somniferum]